ncbi:RNA polymerase II transcription initiation [Tubulinosema ratisbonensis]|uniref:RNA polymerase II transcription initiation n=1 Tax=Tubulinosema ratisbonensis TaxID=291195 RepID=A0A437AQA2_9MICR|nr:RNA polymerase II transcription initiation [Tubulinosema ratisbonensis]
MDTNFVWEEAYKRTWEMPTESVKRKQSYKLKIDKEHRKGIIRHFHIIIDSSDRIDLDGFLPNYRIKIIEALNMFIPQFYQENPISLLSFLVSRDSFDYFLVKENFEPKNLLHKMGKGFFDLENSLKESLDKIENSKYLKEILVITQSISFRNISNLFALINKCKSLNIKINFINLCGEVTLLKKLSQITNGKYFVPLDFEHFKIILFNFTKPSNISNSIFSLLKFGFPESIREESVCACHLQITDSGFICPQCGSKYCDLPSECICGLVLVSFINLSKSMYHNYLLEDFTLSNDKECFICGEISFSYCKKCKSLFCKMCDEFMHEFINFCIFCE